MQTRFYRLYRTTKAGNHEGATSTYDHTTRNTQQPRQELVAKQTKESAWDIIDEYFSFFDMNEIHNELWLLIAGTLTNDEMEPSQKPIDRSNLIFFFEYTRMFFEAVQVLHNYTKKNSC